MREEYDFSNGERGKFYHPDLKLNIPIYLEEEVSIFIEMARIRKNGPIVLFTFDPEIGTLGTFGWEIR